MTTAEATAEDGNWVSLKDASARAGVSISWLRKQYRSNGLPTRDTVGPRGMQKAVPLDEVRRRAAVFAPAPTGPAVAAATAASPVAAPSLSSSPAPARPAPSAAPATDLTVALLDRLFEAQARAARAEAESAYLLLKLDDAYAEIEQLRLG